MYWFGPLLGGILGAILYDFVFASNSSIEKAKSIVTQKDYDDAQFDSDGRRRSTTETDADAGPPLADQPEAGEPGSPDVGVGDRQPLTDEPGTPAQDYGTIP